MAKILDLAARTLIGLTIGLTIYYPLCADGKAKRGEAPLCQKECLSDHQNKTEKLTNEYLRTQNKLEFQKRIEEAECEYRSCLENCEQPYSVK